MNVKDYCDKKGRYPLHQCVLHENKELMQKLINAGADITCQDKKGRTPLHYACKMNSLIYLIFMVGHQCMKHLLEGLTCWFNSFMNMVQIHLQLTTKMLIFISFNSNQPSIFE